MEIQPRLIVCIVVAVAITFMIDWVRNLDCKRKER
jgi:predicted membrane chloride channel (bestrophin family)